MGLRINKISKLAGTFTGTSTAPVATINASTFAIDTSSNMLGTLNAGQIWIGSAGNLPVAQTLSGAITVNNSGVTSIGSGVIVNANINASAAIALSKLAALSNSLAVITTGAGVITTSSTTAAQIGFLSTATSDVQTQLNAKQATITGAASSVVSSNLSANIVAVSDGSGKIASSSVSTTALGFISTLSSNAQTQINSKLTVSLGAAAQGDIIWFNGANWTNLPRGTSGQTLQSTGTSIQWNTQTINGIPVGGSAGQYLAKNSGTDFDASWTSLTLSKVTDVTASSAQVNVLTTGFYDATSSVQTQLNNKLSVVLATNSLFVGIGGVATASTDIPAATTIGTAYVYRVGGNDIAVTDGGTGVSTIPALSVWVANTLNTITTVAPAASQSIRINAGGTAWEAYTPTPGITNSAINNELMKSNGTNAINSDVFASGGAALALSLGNGSTAGTTRTINCVGAGATVDLLLITQGATSKIVFEIDAVEKARVTTNSITLADQVNLIVNTTTGTKIGTSTSQKLSLWNAVPIVQPTTAIAASTFVANTSLIANDTATWDGYTIGQIVKALRNIGILA